MAVKFDEKALYLSGCIVGVVSIATTGLVLVIIAIVLLLLGGFIGARRTHQVAAKRHRWAIQAEHEHYIFFNQREPDLLSETHPLIPWNEVHLDDEVKKICKICKDGRTLIINWKPEMANVVYGTWPVVAKAESGCELSGNRFLPHKNNTGGNMHDVIDAEFRQGYPAGYEIKSEHPLAYRGYSSS